MPLARSRGSRPSGRPLHRHRHRPGVHAGPPAGEHPIHPRAGPSGAGRASKHDPESDGTAELSTPGLSKKQGTWEQECHGEESGQRGSVPPSRPQVPIRSRTGWTWAAPGPRDPARGRWPGSPEGPPLLGARRPWCGTPESYPTPCENRVRVHKPRVRTAALPSGSPVCWDHPTRSPAHAPGEQHAAIAPHRTQRVEPAWQGACAKPGHGAPLGLEPPLALPGSRPATTAKSERDADVELRNSRGAVISFLLASGCSAPKDSERLQVWPEAWRPAPFAKAVLRQLPLPAHMLGPEGRAQAPAACLPADGKPRARRGASRSRGCAPRRPRQASLRSTTAVAAEGFRPPHHEGGRCHVTARPDAVAGLEGCSRAGHTELPRARTRPPEAQAARSARGPRAPADSTPEQPSGCGAALLRCPAGRAPASPCSVTVTPLRRSLAWSPAGARRVHAGEVPATGPRSRQAASACPRLPHRSP